jgi:hypothetical protein
MTELRGQELRVQVREIVCVLRGRRLFVMHLIDPGVVREDCTTQEAWAYVREYAELFGAVPRLLPPNVTYTALTPEELATALGTSVRYVGRVYLPHVRLRREHERRKGSSRRGQVWQSNPGRPARAREAA